MLAAHLGGCAPCHAHQVSSIYNIYNMYIHKHIQVSCVGASPLTPLRIEDAVIAHATQYHQRKECEGQQMMLVAALMPQLATSSLNTSRAVPCVIHHHPARCSHRPLIQRNNPSTTIAGQLQPPLQSPLLPQWM